MEKLATDIYSFKDLRSNGFACVDKTAQILPRTIADVKFAQEKTPNA